MPANTALADTSPDGAFKRQASVWRDSVAPGTRFEPEAGRYHLYISLACPWACRTLAALYLKGLEDVISVSVTHPTWQRTRPDDANDTHAGWAFASPDDPPFTAVSGHGSFPPINCVPDPLNSARYVRDLYDLAGQEGGRYTVPVLWDSKHRTIVNNESSDILRIFNTAFNALAKHPEVDLYPKELRASIDEVNEWVYPQINNGVYRCGFAQKQAPYEEAFRDVYAGLDKMEAILSKQRYLAGDKLTEADIRAFVTLIRFDVYHVYFKVSGARLTDYPAIKGYVQELYAMPAIQRTVDMYHIKTHYYTSHPVLNAYAIVPLGGTEWWREPHTRDKL